MDRWRAIEVENPLLDELGGSLRLSQFFTQQIEKVQPKGDIGVKDDNEAFDQEFILSGS